MTRSLQRDLLADLVQVAVDDLVTHLKGVDCVKKLHPGHRRRLNSAFSLCYSDHRPHDGPCPVDYLGWAVKDVQTFRARVTAYIRKNLKDHPRGHAAFERALAKVEREKWISTQRSRNV